ncbi:YitT family protein [Ligilactobacillus ceti]|uniref:DUF2179 domain-containing protein n=1 Tax=Ligilactobacillus ceti DSM 22408 TaxID=1122146 RepID=A0A0R2KU94_9LACO|nr:YitT family protein [Ligilactobacillus ceti]KRN89812.1 hypothetical protein IV53_GL001139 [Ligilactobacillus ceti DSM 22408]
MKTTKKQTRVIKNIIFNILGAFIYAVAVHGFLITNHLGEGGVTGLMTIFYYWLGIAPALTNLVLNGILLVVGWKLLSKETVFYTLIAVGSISVFLPLLAHLGWSFPLHDKLVAAIIGGILMGIAMGVIMKGEGTIAGSTILARILNKYFGMPTGYALLIFDFAVAIPSGLIIGFENMLLTLLELYGSALILEKCLAIGVDQKALTIMSPYHNEVSQALIDHLGGNTTLLTGKGYRKGREEKLVYYVCPAGKIVKAMNVIKEVDDTAYVVVENVRSTWGYNLKSIL